MGILDKILGKKQPAKKRPDFSGVATGSSSTLGERAERSSAPREPVSPRRAPADATAGAARMYEVKRGDSLSKIAQRFYGNANDWPKIHEANRDQIRDPDLIYPGQKLVIP